MKFIINIFLVGVLILTSCTNNKDQKPEPKKALLTVLLDSINQDLLFEESSICNQQINLLKPLTDYYLLYMATDWGNSCRRTSRLCVFNKDRKYLGNYYLHTEEPFMEPKDNIVKIQVTKEIIDFNNGIPDTVWIAGEQSFFNKGS